MSLYNCQLGAPPDNALPFWINGDLGSVSFDNTRVAVDLLGTTLSGVRVADFAANLYNYFMLPGCFFFPFKEASNSPLWVADGVRSLELGKADALTKKLGYLATAAATISISSRRPPT